MTAITILKRCRSAKTEIEDLQERIEDQREALVSISAPRTDPNGGSHGSAVNDKIGTIYAKIDQLEREVLEREDRWKAEKVAAAALTDRIGGLGGRVLFKYYVQGMDTCQIARQKKKPYAASYIRRVKMDAERLAAMIPEPEVLETLPGWYLRKDEKGGEDEHTKQHDGNP